VKTNNSNIKFISQVSFIRYF